MRSLSGIFVACLLAAGCSTPSTPKEKGMAKEGIRRAVKKGERLFMSCYRAALKRNPKTAGKVVISWDIDTGGKAINSSPVENSTKDVALGNCIAKVVTKLKFPEPPKGEIARINYPLTFSPSNR